MGHYNLIDANQAKRLFNLDTEWKVAIRPESIYVKEPADSTANTFLRRKLG